MTHEEIKTLLTEELGGMKKLITERDAQLKELGEAKASTAKALDEAGNRVMELETELKKARDRADAFEAKMNMPGHRIPGRDRRIISVGQMFTDSDQYKQMVTSGEMKCPPVTLERKDDATLLTTDEESGGAFIVPFRDPTVARLPNLAFTMRSLLNVIPMGVTNAVEYVRRTGFYNLATQLTEAESGGDTVLHVENTVGFFVGQTITISGVEYIVDSIDADALTITIAGDGLEDDVAVDTLVTGITFIGTAEGKVKPKMALAYDLLTATVKTLAHWIPASRQILSDAPQLRAEIDGELTYGLDLTEDWETLNGSGTGQSLEGILGKAGVQTYLWSSGEEGDTRIDAIRRGMTLALKLQLGVDGIVLNNTDWASIQLAKGTDGHYIWLQVGNGTQRQMFMVPVVPSENIAVGTCLIGAFRYGASLYDRQATTIRVAEQHADFAVRNQVAIIGERRMALATKVPQSFVKVTFDAAPSEY